MNPATTTPGAAPAIDIAEHVRLVRWAIARRFSRRVGVGVDADDMLAVGLAALHRAAQTYDPERGSFATFAIFWIRQFINRELQNHGCVVRSPVHRLEQRAKAGLRWHPLVKRLDAPIGNDPDAPTLGDSFADPDAPLPDAGLEARDAKRELAELVDRAGLSEKERRILMLRSADLGLAEIGAEFGVSRERVRQVETKALAKLRAAAGSSATGGMAGAGKQISRRRRAA